MRKEYIALPRSKAPSKYRKERVLIRKSNIGVLISQGLLRKVDSGVLRQISEDEPADMMPSMNSVEFSRFYDPYAQTIDSAKIPVEAMFNGEKFEPSK